MTDTLLELRGIARYFDVSPPWLDRVLERRGRVTLKAVDGIDLTIRKGETRRPRRRIGLRQVDGRAPHRRLVRADARLGSLRRRDHRGRRREQRRARAAARAARHADDLPGPVREPQSALARGGHRRRADPRARCRGTSRARARRARRPRCCSRSGSPPRTARSIRTSSRAGSASASRSRARCRPIRSSWCATSRRRRSTSRCRRRC